MKVVLIRDVPKLGKAGEIKEVAYAYAKNLLLPQKLAALPDSLSAKEFLQEVKRKISQDAAKIKEKEQIFASLNGKIFKFSSKADQEGKLYGSVGPKEIAERLGINSGMVKEHFKKTGEYELKISSGGLYAQVRIVIEPIK